jgi:aspartyl protease family protein
MRIYILTLLISICLSGCSGCSRSGRKNQVNSKNTQSTSSKTIQIKSDNNYNTGSNVIKMKKENGIYLVPIRINGVLMEFIFDTGASDIIISATEALFLFKQGKLSENDFIGKQQYMIADGSISEGTIIILRTVKIGNKTLTDVKASIVHNTNAPLLLGQSALSKFGKISIDYNRLELRFE